MNHELTSNEPKIESIDTYPFGDDSTFFHIRTGSWKKRDRAVDAIEVHSELDGERWVLVFKDGQVIFRIAAVHCAIHYLATPEPTDG